MEKDDVITDTQYLFDLSCSNYTPSCLDRLIVKYKQDPAFNINYQNEYGTTPLLNAATGCSWDFVDVLLKHGADKNIKDKHQQSLLSKALHDECQPRNFVTLLQQYTPEEINAECKSMPLHRNEMYRIVPRIEKNSILAITLKSECMDMNDDYQGTVALYKAFEDIHIPHIVDLFKRNKKLAFYGYPFDHQRPSVHNNMTFVLRETFNNGSCISSLPASLIYRVLFKKYYKLHNLPSEVAQFILQKYIRLLIQNLPEELLPTVEAFLWQPVCIQACQLMGIEDTNAQQCLARILLMLQKQKTELNVKLLLAQGEKV